MLKEDELDLFLTIGLAAIGPGQNIDDYTPCMIPEHFTLGLFQSKHPLVCIYYTITFMHT